MRGIVLVARFTGRLLKKESAACSKWQSTICI
jgi:hypothetical protein